MSQDMVASNAEALNAVGDALKALGLGTVRLMYRAPDSLIPRDHFTLWLDEEPGLCIGAADTPAQALANALALRDQREAA